MELTFYCDIKRHLICVPYSVENLHKMAEILGIKRGWYRSKGKNYHPHYDIPKKRIEGIQSKCVIISKKELFLIIKNSI